MKRSKFCVLPLLLTAALALPARSQETSAPRTNALTLDAAIRIALANNPEIRVLSADIEAARGEVAVARTRQNPELSLAPGIDHTRNPSDTAFHGDFGLQQTFEWPGKRALRRAAAEKNVVRRRLALDGFRALLAIQVRRAVLTLQMEEEVVILKKQHLTLAKSFLEAAQRRVEGGVASEFETIKAEVEIVAAQKSARDAETQRDAARATVNALLGRRPTEPLVVNCSIADDIFLPEPSVLLEQALAQNPAVKAQEAEAERAGLSVQSIRKSRLPDFKLGPSLEYTRDEQIVGFGVNLPLPLWDKKKGEIAVAAAEQKKAAAELETLRRDISRDVITAAQRLAAAKESLAFCTPALRDKLKAALAAAGQNYEEGKIPFLIYLESQRAYFDLQAVYFETLQNTFDARAELESAIGVPLDQLTPPQTKTK